MSYNGPFHGRRRVSGAVPCKRLDVIDDFRNIATP
jgi:hypothetical protein